MKKFISTAILSVLLLTTTFASSALPASAVSSFSISVGYADDLRPTPFFPSPFCGDPSVALFAGIGDVAGCSGGAAFDSGALMITNTGGSPITIDSLTVTTSSESGGQCNSGCALWGGFLPFVLAPGKHAIFTQTSGNNFDVSDFGIPGIGPSLTNNCSVGAESTTATCLNNITEVDVKVDGVTSAFHDVGFTLTTGGYDAVNSVPCPNSKDTTGNCNESEQWRDISSTCGISCPGGNTVPEFGLPVFAVAGVAAAMLLLLRRRFQSNPSGIVGGNLQAASHTAFARIE